MGVAVTLGLANVVLASWYYAGLVGVLQCRVWKRSRGEEQPIRLGMPRAAGRVDLVGTKPCCKSG